MNMNMNTKNLKNLSKSQLIKLLLKQNENGQAQKQIANEFENSIVPQPKQEKSVPRKSVNDYENIILPPPEQFQDRQKKQRPPKPDHFNFDGDIFQTENQSLKKFKIISVQSS